MKRALRKLIDRLVRREPVLFFGAIGLWITAVTNITDDSRAGVALAATVLLFQRAFSTSKATAEENAEVARYAGALEGENRTPATIVNNNLATPARARKVAPKKATPKKG